MNRLSAEKWEMRVGEPREPGNIGITSARVMIGAESSAGSLAMTC
jgi:hypothetical protein